MKRLLIVEDEKLLRENLAEVFVEKGFEVETSPQDREALRRLDEGRYDLVITDLRKPKASGLEVLRKARIKDENALVLVMTDYGSVDSAVQAMRLGAYDYIQKPFELEEMEMKVMRAFDRVRESRLLQALKSREPDGRGIVFESPKMREALALARKVAKTKTTVLITGETGTGKEQVAEIIYRESWRSGHCLVKLNCSAFSEDLIDRELFGCEPGASAGVRRRKIGRFELADEGTLFLDEVSCLPRPTQARLLRAIQDQEFERVGGEKTIQVDVRLIAATSRRLPEAVEQGKFSGDLCRHLAVSEIPVPPLRERKDDILPLARLFLERYCRETHRSIRGFTPEAEHLLLEHSWPGNVRELDTAIERSVLMTDGEWVSPDPISWREVHPRGEGGSQPSGSIPGDLGLEELERAAVLQALRRADWVQKNAAAILGISSRVMNYKIRKHNLTNSRWRRYRPTGKEHQDAG